MRILSLISVFLLAVSLFGGAEALVVKEISIEGNKLVALKEIKSAITFKEGDTVTEESIKESLQKIFELGYFQQVTPDLKEVEGGVKIVFKVVENPKVEKIEIVGNKQYIHRLNLLGLKIPLANRLVKTDRILEILKEHGIEKGKILNIKKLQQAIVGGKGIIAEYQKNGYALISIGEVKLQAHLFIEIIEGQVEEIVISGLREVHEEQARKLIKIPLKEPVKIPAIQESFKNINSSIYFTKTSPKDISIELGSQSDLLKLIWNLKERKLIDKPIMIKEISLTGNTVYSTARLMKLLKKLPPGEVTNFQLLQALEGVYNLYYKEGYSQIDFKVEELKDGHLVIKISEGRIKSIEIKGNKRTKDYVILKELRLKPGEIFNERALQDSYRNLQSLGYFANVAIDLAEEESRDEDERLKLIVAVTEQEKLGSLSGSLAYAKGGLVGKISLAWKNLFGTGQDISLNYDRGLVGPEAANWNLKYNTHAFFKDFNFLTLSLFNEVKQESAPEKHQLTKTGREVSLGYPLGGGAQLILGTRHESFSKSAPINESGITDSITLELMDDDRNNLNFPTSGGTRSIRIEKAGGFSVSSVEFTKLQLTLVQHFPTIGSQNLAIRALSGLGFTLPSQERFLLGGAATLRGIDQFAAEKIFLLNAEYRIKIIEEVTGVIFWDMGLGEAAAAGATSTFQIQAQNSFGLEMRVITPFVGLVRLIFAWPIKEGKIEWTPKIDFSLGPMF